MPAEDGQHLNVIAMDVTERKKNEAELDKYRCHLEDLVAQRTDQIIDLNHQLEIRAQEAEAANRAKSAFLSKHEPRNSYANECHHWTFLPIAAEGDLNTEQQDKLRKIVGASNHLVEPH